MVHLVDLDAACRRGQNAALLRRLIDELAVPVQLSGGIDTPESARRSLATGAARINLASSALLAPDLVRSLVDEHGGRIVVGVDVRQGHGAAGGDQVVARGSDVSIGGAPEVIDMLASVGPAHVLVADASRDGSRRGIDLEMFTRMTELIGSQLPDAGVIVSGGVASLADVRALRTLVSRGLRGVVLGSALHHGTFTLEQATAVLAEEESP